MEEKCTMCGKDTSGYKCDACGEEASKHDEKHGCGEDHCMAKCAPCGEAQKNCTCQKEA